MAYNQQRCEVNVLLYNRKYLSLQEGMLLVAHRLAAADRQGCVGANAAIDEAKKQLLEALFEGAIRAEGVKRYPAQPFREQDFLQYDEWIPIVQGLWPLDRTFINWSDNRLGYFNTGTGQIQESVYDNIRLLRDDIEREFPVPELPASGPTEEDYRTGLPGKPSPKNLALEEMQRRAKEGILCSGIGAEMRELCRWLKEKHPKAPPTLPSSLETALRQEYWSLKGGKKPASVSRRSRDTAV
jgi:hypothetical protein